MNIVQHDNPSNKIFTVPNLKQSIEKIDKESLSTYTRMVSEMELIYATASFDTFLTDIARFCVVSMPNMFLKSKSIPASTVLADSFNATLNKVVDEVVFDMARRSLSERIKYLGDRLSVDFGVTDDQLNTLRKWTAVRNSLMHDRSIRELSFGPDLKLSFTKKAVDTEVTAERDRAIETHGAVVVKLFLGLLKFCSGSDEVKQSLQAVTEILSGPFLQDPA